MTLRHEHPGVFPRDISFTPAAYDTFRRGSGCDDPVAYFRLECRGVGYERTSSQAEFGHYYDDGELPPGVGFDDYGVARVPGGYYHFTHIHHPAKRFSSVAQYDSYPWPTYRYGDDAADRVAEIQEQGYAVTSFAGHIWEVAWGVRGMDNLMLDFIERPDMAQAVLEPITANVEACAAEAARIGCDVVMFGDDVGMQDRLMMSPGMWRDWLFPCLKRAVSAARAVRPDVHCWYHSDGDIRQIIPDLIEAGIDVLNPIQPECMSPKALRAEYGKQLAFWGCVGTQTTFPFGTPAEMRRTVRDLVETVGQSGGLVVAPTHVLEPEVPWENMLAFLEALEEDRGD